MIAYINKKFLPLEECHLNIADLGLQRGYGIFDFFRAEGDQLIWKEEYFDRLFGSIEGANIGIDLDRDGLEDLCIKLQSKNKYHKSTFKVIITGGFSSDMGTYEDTPSLIIIQKPFKPLPNETYTDGVNLITEEYQRPDPEVKTLNYFFSLRMHQKIKDYDALDVLFHTDQIRETARSNFFGIKNGIIHTPKEKILKGITRKNVLKLKSKGFDFEERDIFIEELFTFDEVFITGTTKFIAPVVKIDGKTIGLGIPGQITKKLITIFNPTTYLKPNT